MLRYTAKRIGLILPILLGVSLVVFVLLHLTPGSPVDALLGPIGTPQQRASLEHDLGLAQPLPVQYFSWLRGIATGNLGTSIAAQSPVLPIISDAFLNTLILTAFAGAVAVIGGLVLGTLWATSPHAAVRRVAAALSVSALSAPQYAVAVILIVVVGVQLQWLPVGGMYSSIDGGGLVDLGRHIVLPGIAAALVPLGIIARMFRASLLDVLDQGFVESLTARGLSRARVLAHAAHNAMPPMLTVAGLQFGYLLGGVLFVEVIFVWPGMGLAVYQAITQRDYPIIQAGVLLGAFAFVALNLVVDVLHAAVDPRIRH
ncbi:MAG TPA: ABC transporter permease [Candidatus Dormibacteraeota bacterium]|jgi:peptide/nickel transport system permease protein|nr:ABC transporter permease [Candidatus Dormibacteraeota bacterium]